MGIMTTAISPRWCDKLTYQSQGLYNKIQNECLAFDSFDEELQAEFFLMLLDLGIKTDGDFEDAYCTSCKTLNDESHLGDFSEWLTLEVDGIVVPDGLTVDWMSSWYRNHRYEFHTIDFQGETYFFHKDFKDAE